MKQRRVPRSRRALLGAALGVVLCGCVTPKPRSPKPKVGQPLRELKEAYLMGIGPRSLEEARGSVVIVEFWATYCEPCKRSFPTYEELHRQAGVHVISVSLDEPEPGTEAAIKAFVDETGATFGVLWDADQSSLRTYGLRKMPTAFIVDEKGVLRHTHGGYEASTADEIKRQVAALLAESP